MMVAIEVEYQGELHCHAVHGPSESTLNTDAPKDNQGRGESFAPTDLVATALGSCILTTMGILARTLDVDMSGAKASVEKEMTSAPPRMIRRLTVVLSMPWDLFRKSAEIRASGTYMRSAFNVAVSPKVSQNHYLS
jgi:putative redox protein